MVIYGCSLCGNIWLLLWKNGCHGWINVTFFLGWIFIHVKHWPRVSTEIPPQKQGENQFYTHKNYTLKEMTKCLHLDIINDNMVIKKLNQAVLFTESYKITSWVTITCTSSSWKILEDVSHIFSHNTNLCFSFNAPCDTTEGNLQVSFNCEDKTRKPWSSQGIPEVIPIYSLDVLNLQISNTPSIKG